MFKFDYQQEEEKATRDTRTEHTGLKMTLKYAYQLVVAVSSASLPALASQKHAVDSMTRDGSVSGNLRN
jgi:hypothetical protein